MPTDHHLDPDEDALAQMGYELEDVEFKSLGRSIFWFFGFVAFCGIAGVIIFFLFLSGGSPSGALNLFMKPPENTAPFVSRIPASPNPLLQTGFTAKSDIRDLRQNENTLLQGKPTWVDQGKGVVRIPVAKAMDLYLQRIGSNPSQATTITSGAPPVDTGSAEGTEGEAPPKG